MWNCNDMHISCGACIICIAYMQCKEVQRNSKLKSAEFGAWWIMLG